MAIKNQTIRINHHMSWRNVVLEAIAGVVASAAFGLLGGYLGPWLADRLGQGPGLDALVWSVIGLLVGTVIGAAGGVYYAGRTLGQQGVFWLTGLGSLLGAAVGMGILTVLGSLDRSVLTVWGLIGGGAVALAVVGYNLIRR